MLIGIVGGAYDSNDNFRFLNEKKKINPIINVKRNSAVILSREITRLGIKNQTAKTKDFFKWKKKKRYGNKWMAETAFSSIKRMFGEHIMATRFQNMVKEMILKVSLYNLFRRTL